MNAQYTLRGIVSKLGGELIGDGELIVTHVASISNAKPGHITFLATSRHISKLIDTRASAIVVSEENRHVTELPRIIADNPYAYFARLSALMNPSPVQARGVDASAVVHDTATIPSSCVIAANCVIGRDVQLGENVVIASGCILGERVTIGEGSELHANVVVYQDTVIGKHCVIAAGAIIGSNGFGYAEDSGRWVKIPQVGRVVIEDHVDIGANTTIDRGTLDDTVIEEGVKLDNLIQIGHNCRIGAHTVIAGCVGVAGSAVIGKHCKIGGAAMILGHLEIADGTTISPGSMITRSLAKAGTYTALMPFQAHDDWVRTAANIRRLGDLAERVKQLEKELGMATKKTK